MLMSVVCSAKVDPALIARFRLAMVGCFWPIFLFCGSQPLRELAVALQEPAALEP